MQAYVEHQQRKNISSKKLRQMLRECVAPQQDKGLSKLRLPYDGLFQAWLNSFNTILHVKYFVAQAMQQPTQANTRKGIVFELVRMQPGLATSPRGMLYMFLAFAPSHNVSLYPIHGPAAQNSFPHKKLTATFACSPRIRTTRIFSSTMKSHPQKPCRLARWGSHLRCAMSVHI